MERTRAASDEWLDVAEAALTARNLHLAVENFDKAQQAGADPDHCSGGRWIASMLSGDFESAWREGDQIRARGVPDEHRFWQGEDPHGKRLIVRSLHGFGDAVMMLRYAPKLRGIAASVVYEVAPKLLPLVRCFAGVENVITWGEDMAGVPVAWDVQVEVMELPYLFRTTVADLPLATNYLHLPHQEIERAQLCMGADRHSRVGVVWTCGDWNLTRSVPAELLQPLFSDTRIEFWSLESPKHSDEANLLNLRDANARCGDGLLALAATIANLDLVITVDTLAAHLAGALGKPAWVMLQHAADWRWMHGRSDTPWYPTVRLFRQPTAGDWAGVVAEVKGCLSEQFA